MPHKQLEQTRSFTVPGWSRDEPLSNPTHPEIQPLFAEKAEVLEIAKRRACVSFAKMNAAPDANQQSAWAAATTRDEQDVLRARVDMLNTLMQAPDPKLSIENTAPPKVCVTYDRIRMDDTSELGPMQSTMTWIVPGAEDQVPLEKSY
jgi:hypothetical protein